MSSTSCEGTYCKYPYVERPKRHSDEMCKKIGDFLKEFSDEFERFVKHRVAMAATGRDGDLKVHSRLERSELDSDEIKEIGKMLRKRADEFEYLTKCWISMICTRHDDKYCKHSYIERPKLGSEEGDKEFGDTLKKCADEFEDLMMHRVYLERSGLEKTKKLGKLLKKCADKFVPKYPEPPSSPKR